MLEKREQIMNVASVYIMDAPVNADKPYDYFLPEELRSEVCPGCFVSLPFGRGNRQCTAVVFFLKRREDVSELKAVTQVIETGGLILGEEMRELCLFMKEQTFCTVGDAVSAMVPSGALRGLCACYRTLGAPMKELNEPAKAVYALIADKTEKNREEGIGGQALVEKFGREVNDLLSSLLKLKVIERFFRVADRSGRLYEKIYAVGRREHVRPKGKKQAEIYDAVAQSGELTASELRERFGGCAPQLAAMIEKGQLCMRQEELYRRAYQKRLSAPDDNVLTEEQERAKETILSLCRSGEAKAALLYGVTGSGKTRVMKAVIDHVLAEGKSVIVLVPEISLTPQTVGLFSSFFGDEVAIIHSSLSAGQRFDEWRRLKEGRARICIGTRSAVFAPVDDLGLIIIDEEQEHTYKSDMTPRYHARDVARFRCAKNNAVLLLCSATPSIESYYKAKEGKYTLCTLKQRYGSGPMPKAILCDMRGEQRLVSPIGGLLASELQTNVERGEQSILFVGRRGYNNFVTCTLCGETIVCPHCSVSMTYHSFGRYRPEENSMAERARHGQLVCHYCGTKMPVPQTCPSCASNLLQFIGSGTQKVESDLARLFPDVPTLRLDADTTGGKDSFETKLDSFRKGEAQIMLGTQMVTKGHDFPNVTLVGVILADTGLYMDDFRAGEHTFSLITQVIGRAGRGEKPGRAVIQTYRPDHPTLVLAAKQDYPAFYDNEIRLRRSLVFPPFCDVLLISFSCREEQELHSAVREADEKLRELRAREPYTSLPMTVFGPFEAPLYRLKDQFRMRFIIKTRNTKNMRALVKELMCWASDRFKQRVSVYADINPSSI